jgi:hypothetical protein
VDGPSAEFRDPFSGEAVSSLKINIRFLMAANAPSARPTLQVSVEAKIFLEVGSREEISWLPPKMCAEQKKPRQGLWNMETGRACNVRKIDEQSRFLFEEQLPTLAFKFLIKAPGAHHLLVVPHHGRHGLPDVWHRPV